MKIFRNLFLFLFLFLLLPNFSYSAIVPLYTASQLGGHSFGGGYGIAFSVTKKLQVDALARRSTVGAGITRLWKNGVQVSNASIPISVTPINGYRYVSVTPVIFNIGDQLVITSDEPSLSTQTASLTTFIAQDGLVWNNNYYIYNANSLSPRSDYYTHPVYRAAPINANAGYSIVPTPEPVTYLMLGSFLMVGGLLFYRNKRKIVTQKL